MQNLSQKLYLAIDGGGTKCRARLVDDNNNILAQDFVNEPANLQIENGERAYQTIMGLSKKIFKLANLDLSKDGARVYACFGVAGARSTKAKKDFAKRNFPFANTLIVDDIDIALAGAHEGKDGAALIIGTGSAGLGIVNGERFQIGGWGFYVGDDMSGAILGRKLLRTSLLAHEGIIEASDLTKKIMEQFNNSAENLMLWSFNNNGGKPALPAHYAGFIPLLLEYFTKGDKIAKKLLDYEISTVGKYVNWFKSRGIEKIAIIGGFGTAILPILKEKFGKIIVEPKASPIEGAIIMAKKLNSGKGSEQ